MSQNLTTKNLKVNSRLSLCKNLLYKSPSGKKYSCPNHLAYRHALWRLSSSVSSLGISGPLCQKWSFLVSDFFPLNLTWQYLFFPKFLFYYGLCSLPCLKRYCPHSLKPRRVSITGWTNEPRKCSDVNKSQLKWLSILWYLGYLEKNCRIYHDNMTPKCI